MRISETETIIKKVLPYLERRGYDLSKDLNYEEPAVLDTEYKKGFIDILVTLGKKNPSFTRRIFCINKFFTFSDYPFFVQLPADW